MEKFNYNEQWLYMTKACLNITDACNLCCRYCFVEQHPHFMSLQTAKDSADWLYQNLQIKKEKGYAQKDDKCTIVFFGGEPMLLYDEIIVPLVTYCKEKYPDSFIFGMTTNTTLLYKERVDFLYDNNIFPLLSIDGIKSTQDYNRPCRDGTSSFDKVYANLPYILEKMPNLAFRSTIYQDTVNETFKNYLFAEKIGFKNYYTMPNCREKWTEENKEILKKEIKKIFLYQIDKFLNNELPMNFSRINDTFNNILKQDIGIVSNNYYNFAPNVREVARCGLGTVGGSIAYDGTIYGCQEQDSHGKDKIFMIGNIYNGGINKELHEKLLKTISISTSPICDNEQLCNNCSLYKICHFYCGLNCPSESYDLFNNFNTQPEMGCFWHQLLAENCLIMQKILTEQNNQTFKKYLDDKCQFSLYYQQEEI